MLSLFQLHYMLSVTISARAVSRVYRERFKKYKDNSVLSGRPKHCLSFTAHFS